MGVLTDFFVASEAELRAAFPSWLSVGEKNRQRPNPFKPGELMLTWGADPQAMEERASRDRQAEADLGTWQRLRYRLFPPTKPLCNIAQFPNYRSSNILLTWLASLASLTYNTTDEEFLCAIDKPPLIDPETTSEGLCLMPRAFVHALAGLSATDLENVAQKLSERNSCDIAPLALDEARSIIQEMRKLACIAQTESKQVYHWWCC